MDEEENKQDIGEKINNDIQDTTRLAKDGTNLAKDIGTGNVLGTIKDAFNLAKNKKFWILLAISIFTPIIVMISLAAFTLGIFDAAGDKLQETTAQVKEFFDWDHTEGIISIKDSEVKKIIEAMEEINVTIDSLKLMGDVDYTNPEIAKENEKALIKYVRKFYEAQAVTQTFYPKPGFFNRLFNLNKTYGAVYVHRTNAENEVNPKDENNILKYIEYKDMERKATGTTQGDINDIRQYFSVEGDKLVIPYWTETDGKVKISLKKVNYKNVISQYTTTMNFFFYLATITENAEFVAAVADMVKNSEIHITVLESKNTVTETNIHKQTPNYWEYREGYWENGRYIEIPDFYQKTLAETTTTTTTTTTSISVKLAITYVRTWFCEQTINYTKEPIYSSDPYSYDKTNDSMLEDDIQPPKPEVQYTIDDEGEKTPMIPQPYQTVTWYTNKKRDTTIVRDGYTYKESSRTDVEDKTGEKGDQGVKHNDADRKVEGKEWIDENTTFLGLLDDFFRLPKTDRYEAAGHINFVNGAEWLFILLQKDPDLQKMEQLMRYIMFKYTGDDYGATEFDFQIFDAKDFIEISGGSSKLLKQYIRYWENGSGAPTNADGTKYIVQDDGYGHPTVGYGIDIQNSGYLAEFIAAGYSTEIGAEIDVEFVDALEDRFISSKLDEIKTITNGLDLKGYQINALVSRAYNCGTNGALTTLRGSPSMNFVSSYNSYWNSATDDYFEEQNPNADFSHQLYTQYMSKPVTSNNEYSLGLERRRKSEWTLFQTGYYDVLNTWHTGGGDLVAACEELTQTLIARGVNYSLSYGLISRRYREML